MKIPRNKDFPRELLIAEQMWSLRFVRNIDTKHYDVLGECNYAENEILIRLKQDRFNTWITLIHECIHAMAPWLTESQVKKLEIPLSLFILENFQK